MFLNVGALLVILYVLDGGECLTLHTTSCICGEGQSSRRILGYVDPRSCMEVTDKNKIHSLPANELQPLYRVMTYVITALRQQNYSKSSSDTDMGSCWLCGSNPLAV